MSSRHSRTRLRDAARHCVALPVSAWPCRSCPHILCSAQLCTVHFSGERAREPHVLSGQFGGLFCLPMVPGLQEGTQPRAKGLPRPCTAPRTGAWVSRLPQ